MGSVALLLISNTSVEGWTLLPLKRKWLETLACGALELQECDTKLCENERFSLTKCGICTHRCCNDCLTGWWFGKQTCKRCIVEKDQALKNARTTYDNTTTLRWYCLQCISFEKNKTIHVMTSMAI